MTNLAIIDQNYDEKALEIISLSQSITDSTKKRYSTALSKMFEAGASLADRESIITYAGNLSASQRVHLRPAITRLASEMEMKLKADTLPLGLHPDEVQPWIWHFEALATSVEAGTGTGDIAHKWLTKRQVKLLANHCNDDTLACLRDQVVIGLLVAAGLRRIEVSRLRFDHFQTQSEGDKSRLTLNIDGKGDKKRAVPISAGLQAVLEKWQKTVEGGFVGRAFTPQGKLKDTISGKGIVNIVRKAGAAIGEPDLAPHDLRRTYARLAYEKGLDIDQLRKLLGHSSVRVTQKYINSEIDLKTTASDLIPFP